jgi:murein DD-endopeptidase MepM/ murein hydrolase activator NlpD
MRAPIVALPLEGALSVTSPFGPRTSPFTGEQSFHPGVDLHADEGTPVYAPISGTAHTYPNAGDGGNIVSIDGDDGWTVNLDHLSLFNIDGPVHVNAGDLVAWSGHTGAATAPHLHVELRPPPQADGSKSDVIDPWPFLHGSSLVLVVVGVVGIVAAAAAGAFFWWRRR